MNLDIRRVWHSVDMAMTRKIIPFIPQKIPIFILPEHNQLGIVLIFSALIKDAAVNGSVHFSILHLFQINFRLPSSPHAVNGFADFLIGVSQKRTILPFCPKGTANDSDDEKYRA